MTGISLHLPDTAGEPVPSAVRNLGVLTLTPFYPSAEQPWRGRFISDVLHSMSEFSIDARVMAVQPSYRVPQSSCDDAVADWHRYSCFPTNLGLASSGRFLSGSIRSRISSMQRSAPLDVIHAHGALPCGHAAMCLAAQLGIPFVVSVHGLDVFSDQQAGRVAGRWTRRVSERVYRSARRVVCISERVRCELPDDVQPHARVIYNGVDPGRFSPQEARTPGTILSVGNLIAIKGHALLIRAFARISTTFPAVRIEIIGEGPEHRRLRSLARDLGLESRVAFRGACSRSEVVAAMRNCALFALPSNFEGLGCVYLEAMACGKPIIGCTGQGIAEVIAHGKNGLLVSPNAEQELADNLAMLLQNQTLRRRIGEAARATVLHGLTLEHQARQLAEIYRGCRA